jgi:hypothetical protein
MTDNERYHLAQEQIKAEKDAADAADAAYQSAAAARQSAYALDEQNRLIQEQIWVEQQNAWELKHSIDEQNDILRAAENRKRDEAYKKTAPQRRAKMAAAIDECMRYGDKNGFLPVYICLPVVDYPQPYHKDKIKQICIDPYIKIDRCVYLSEYGLAIDHKFTKAFIKGIQQNIKDGNIIKIKKTIDHGGYVLARTGDILTVNTSGDQEKSVSIGQAECIVWLKKEEIDDFAAGYKETVHRLELEHENMMAENLRRNNKAMASMKFRRLLAILWKYGKIAAGVIIALVIIGKCSSGA